MSDNDRHEFCYGTTRICRLMRIGMVFHLEILVAADDWKVVARIDGPDAYVEACQELAKANVHVLKQRQQRAGG